MSTKGLLVSTEICGRHKMWIRCLLFGFCYLVTLSSSEIVPDGTMNLDTSLAKSRAFEAELNDSSTEEGGRRQSDECIFFPKLGCFEMGGPWSSRDRPIEIPDDPENIKTTVQLYTRLNSVIPDYIPLYPTIEIKSSVFDPDKKSVIIVHGFASSGNSTWIRTLKDVYLRKVDANVMIVDWGHGARFKNYATAVANTRIVGKQLSQFAEYLISEFDADPSTFHLIGHSLGAHICSYMAKNIKGIGRLTALDPAQPYFEGLDSKVRLDKSDANFVDVVHTDATPFIPTLGFGMIKPHGHVDFYMNGGYGQPKCSPLVKRRFILHALLRLGKYIAKTLSNMVSCSHARAYEYFIEALNNTNNCTFYGLRANTQNLFKTKGPKPLNGKLRALSSYCFIDNCLPLGFDTEKAGLNGVFVVNTNSGAPYCRKPIEEPEDEDD